jgi:hypothetical protein
MIWGARTWTWQSRDGPPPSWRAGGRALRCLEPCARHAGDSASTTPRTAPDDGTESVTFGCRRRPSAHLKRWCETRAHCQHPWTLGSTHQKASATRPGCAALRCSAPRCSALVAGVRCLVGLGAILGLSGLLRRAVEYLPTWAVGGCAARPASRQLQLGQRQNQTKTRAPDDIVDLPYLTQSCLGHADPRDLSSASCASNDSNVGSCSYSDLNHQASLLAPGSLGPTVARSPCFSHAKSRNLFQSEAAAIDCGPSSSSTGSSSACMAPSFGHWAIASDTLSVQT